MNPNSYTSLSGTTCACLEIGHYKKKISSEVLNTVIVDQEFSHTCLYEPLISQAVVEERKAGALKEWTYFEAMKAALSKQGKSKSSKSPVAASTR